MSDSQQPLALPAGVRDDWRRVGDRTASDRIALVSVTAETTVYEHVPTADALAALRDDPADDGETDAATPDVPARSLFTVDLTFSPSLATVGLDPAGALGTAAPKAKGQFVETLEADGIGVGEQRTSEPFERADGTAGRRYVLAASYPVGSAAAPAGRDGTLPAEAHVAVWPTDEAYAMVGGVVPLEAPAGLEAELDVDPERDRERLLEVIRTIDDASGGDDAENEGDAGGDRDGDA